MKTILFATLFSLSATCSSAQVHLDPAKLLTKHFNVKSTGTPPRITWVPQGEDAKRFDYLPDKNVTTVVDTMLAKGEVHILVFFRTIATMDGGSIEPDGIGDDWLSVALYAYSPANKTEGGRAPTSFQKWFLKQGTYLGSAKPRMAGPEGTSLFVITSDVGETEMHTRTEHFYSLPDLRPVLQVETGSYEEDRSGPHGPMLSMTERTMKVVSDPANWKEFPDIEVTGVEGTDGKTARFVWSDQLKKYAEAKTAPQTTPIGATPRAATKVPSKPTLKKR